ncbi:hypothetical protein [Coprococcus sp. OM06-25]|nr:hypothetical protein [Coprococcus sp. OM06-25]RGI40969.1 hypothetical protein DXB88_10850 [Coprococcus sp. OM06-25]
MDIRKKTVKATLRDEEIKKLQEQVLQLHRDKTALMSKCKTLSRGLPVLFVTLGQSVYMQRRMVVMKLRRDGHTVMRAYIVYDQQNDGSCAGIMSEAHLARFLGIARGSIRRQLWRGDKLFLRRYEVVRCWIDPDDYEYLQVDDSVGE